jgi:hypothetical protein
MASPLPYLRFLALGAFTLALAACGGGGGTAAPGAFGPNPFVAQCDPGTQVQLANPQPGQFGVPTNIGSIVIVANGNNNALYSTYPQWFVILTDNFGNTINGGPLSLTSYPNGPHPYQSDFYYSSSIGNLPAGATWNAGLVSSNNNCSADPLGSFST